MTKLKPFQLFLVLTGVVVLIAQLVYWIPHHVSRSVPNMDFPIYYEAGKRVLNGWPAYGEYRIRTLYERHGAFFYPPPFAALMTVFARLDFRVYQAVWYVLLFAAYWAYAAALGRLARVSILVAGGLVISANTTSMSFGNVDLFVWALCAWAFAAEDEDLTVVLLVLGAATKLYPIFPLAIVLARSRQPNRALGVTVATASFVLAATVLMIGTRQFSSWLFVGLPSLSAGSFDTANASLSVAVLRLAELLGLAQFDRMAPALPDGARLFLTVMSLVGTGVVALLTRRWNTRAQACAVMIAAVLFAPVCWQHQLPIAAIPIAMWWGQHWSHR